MKAVNWTAIFNDEVEFPDGLSVEQKIEILKLSDERVQELLNMKIEAFPEDLDATYEEEKKIISVDDVVGFQRVCFVDNWIDALEDKCCHKYRNFMIYDEKSFDEVLLKHPLEDYPEVYEIENKYYIGGGGLHRLTMAKCLGNKKAMVCVKKKTN